MSLELDDNVLRAKILAAYEVVSKHPNIILTSLIQIPSSAAQQDVQKLWVKMESMQTTGSFKLRGIVYQIDEIKKKLNSNQEFTLVTQSAGNYGKALAWFCSRDENLKAYICVPEFAPERRRKIMESYGAVVQRVPVRELDQCVNAAIERGSPTAQLCHSFDDLDLVLGHASLGMELIGQVDTKIDIVIVGCGGGGLVSAIATALRLLGGENFEKTRIYAVEPESAPTMYRSFKNNAPNKLGVDDKPSGLASGLSPPAAGCLPYQLCRRFITDVVLVNDVQIADAMKTYFELGLVSEPSGAASLAALRSNLIPDSEGKNVVCVLSGGNTTCEELLKTIGPLMEV